MQSPLSLSFNELVQLAKQDPHRLEILRQEACEALISSANPEDQRKLKGLQFKIDMERRRAKSSSAACMRLSEMMHDSFNQLKTLLSQTKEKMPHKLPPHLSCNDASSVNSEDMMSLGNNIFPFPSH